MIWHPAAFKISNDNKIENQMAKSRQMLWATVKKVITRYASHMNGTNNEPVKNRGKWSKQPRPMGNNDVNNNACVGEFGQLAITGTAHQATTTNKKRTGHEILRT
jgi:hypothetical protein